MRRYLGMVGLVIAVAIAVIFGKTQGGDAQQVAANYTAPRSPFGDGKPSLDGFWQAMNTANWNLEGHSAGPGPIPALGAAGAVPPGFSVVEGGEIPYQPAALLKRDENRKNALKNDPEVACYMPGVPRATYLPHPFQILQTDKDVTIVYQFASAVRNIFIKKPQPNLIDTWMGTSNGRWEGDTLVVEVTGLDPRTWFDRSGNFHSEAVKVVERYTRTGPDHMRYEATIEDPQVYTRPWKMSMMLYRHVEPNFQLLEYRCIDLAEEALYGHLYRRKTTARTTK